MLHRAFGISPVLCCRGIAILALFCLNCGGRTLGDPDSTGAIDAGPCPIGEPAADTSCLTNGIVCGYGSSRRSDCRVVFTCEGRRWVKGAASCPSVPSDFCPTEPMKAAECAPKGFDGLPPRADGLGPGCVHANGAICHCPCLGGRCDPTSRWQCFDPPAADCPPVAPNLGTACDVESRECTYGHSCSPPGTRVRCLDSRWQRSPAICPL